MKYLISGFFLLFLSVVSVNAQTLSNIDFFAEGKKVVITYDLSDCEAGEFYDVTLNFVEQSTLKVTVPKTISGDIKKLTCGSKRIVWNIGADVSSLSGRFYPELEVKKTDKSIVSDIDGNTYKTVQIGTQNLELEVKKTDNSNLTDIEGNSYKVVKIGNQVWMAENLKTSKYSDGTPIPNVVDNHQWSNLTTGAWAYYNNDAAYNAKYGKLYNWYVVSKTTNGNKNVCPTGWHEPTDAEWNVLTDYLGGVDVAGGKMKEAGAINWKSPNTDATNTSLFTGLPGGLRDDGGGYYDIGYYGTWWSSTEHDTGNAWYRLLDYGNGDADRNNSYYYVKKFGFSVRCLRD
jgi:uncharacterized protein (TIGR02145 family)